MSTRYDACEGIEPARYDECLKRSRPHPTGVVETLPESRVARWRLRNPGVLQGAPGSCIASCDRCPGDCAGGRG